MTPPPSAVDAPREAATGPGAQDAPAGGLVQRPRALGPDLFGLLAAAVLLDVLVAKVAVELVRPELFERTPHWLPALYTLGAFIHYFTEMLALLVCAYYLLAAGLRPRFFPLPVRAPLAAATVVFLGLLTVSVLGGAIKAGPISPIVRIDLVLTFALLIVLLAVGLALRNSSLGARIAVAALALPVVLAALAFVVGRGEGAAAEQHITTLRDYEEWVALLLPPLLLITLAPRVLRSGRRPGPVLVALLVTLALAVFEQHHADVLIQAARVGLGLELPLDPRKLMVFGSALFFASAAVLALVTGGAPERRTGYGLLIILASGLTFWYGADVATSMAGFLGMVFGAARAADEAAAHAVAPSDDRWSGYVTALARALAGAGRTGRDGGRQVAAVTGVRDGLRVAAHIERGALGVESVGVLIGEAIPERPAWTIDGGASGIGAVPGSKVAPGPRVLTGDDTLDATFRVHDAVGLTRDLLDDEARTRLPARLDGWIGVWPGRAVLFVAGAPVDTTPLVPLARIAESEANDAAPAEPLLALVDVLLHLARRAGVGAHESATAPSPESGAPPP